MLKYWLHQRAAAEFDAIFAWYAARDPEVAAGFAELVERAIGDVCRRPLAHPMWPKIAPGLGVRRCVMDRFPYTIPFIVEGDTVIIVAFAHHRRRPGYWIRRVRTPRATPRK